VGEKNPTRKLAQRTGPEIGKPKSNEIQPNWNQLIAQKGPKMLDPSFGKNPPMCPPVPCDPGFPKETPKGFLKNLGKGNGDPGKGI